MTTGIMLRDLAAQTGMEVRCNPPWRFWAGYSLVECASGRVIARSWSITTLKKLALFESGHGIAPRLEGSSDR